MLVAKNVMHLLSMKVINLLTILYLHLTFFKANYLHNPTSYYEQQHVSVHTGVIIGLKPNRLHGSKSQRVKLGQFLFFTFQS